MAYTVLRLLRFFGTSTEFWLNLQAQYDIDMLALQFTRVRARQLLVRLNAVVLNFQTLPNPWKRR